MNRLDVLRDDMETAGRAAWDADERPTDACLAILDEFRAEVEVVKVDEAGPVSHDPFRAWYEECGDSLSLRRTSIIVPRDPEPRITDHTLTERMAVLEDEVKHRCGNLGRRVNALESKRRPLLEAAKRAVRAMGKCNSTDIADFWAAQRALAAAIKEERER